MTFEPWQIAVAAGAVFLAFVLQGAVGFGSGLLTVPVLLWAGIELPDAVALVVIAVFVQTGWGCWQLRREIPWRTTGVIAGLRTLSVPAGLWVMVTLTDGGLALTKQVIGGVLLVIMAVQWLVRVEPVDRLHPAWTPVAALSSGVMAGSVGMGGPPVVLWTMAHDWPALKSRAFLWSLFLTWVPVHLPVLLWWFGGSVLEAMIVGAALSPFVLAGAGVGDRLGRRLSRKRLRIAAYLALTCIAIASIVGPMFD